MIKMLAKILCTLQDLLKAQLGSRWSQHLPTNPTEWHKSPLITCLHIFQVWPVKKLSMLYWINLGQKNHLLLVSPNLLTGVATTRNSSLLFCDLHYFIRTSGHYFGGFLSTWNVPLRCLTHDDHLEIWLHRAACKARSHHLILKVDE